LSETEFLLNTTYLLYYYFWGSGCPHAPLSGGGIRTSYPSWPRNATPIEAVQIAAGWRHAPPPKLDTSLVWRNFRPTHCL